LFGLNGGSGRAATCLWHVVVEPEQTPYTVHGAARVCLVAFICNVVAFRVIGKSNYISYVNGIT
jgi:hypothetical protein